jgi:hypothetical protein
MMPPAPGLGSTITGTPRIAASGFAITRDETSVTPPADEGTTQVIALVGKDWAAPGWGNRQAANAKAQAQERTLPTIASSNSQPLR